MQKFLLGTWFGLLSSLPIQAQTDSLAIDQRRLERIAVLDISGPTLNRKQSQKLTQALSNVCREESRFVVASEIALGTYLKKRRQFSIFVADSVQALCKNLSLDYLIVSIIERVSSSESPWQVTLRWLDGSTGQITKIHARECSGDVDTPDSFPLRELLFSLLESPDIIIAVADAPTEISSLPATWPPEVKAPAVDSLAVDETMQVLPHNHLQSKRGRNWLWYVTGAALLSGGSAALLWKNPSKSGAGKTLLPEPPDPPK